MKTSVDLNKSPQSIAIELHFNGPQPNHFDAQLASATPMTAGDFIGDTRQGGSCNAEHISFNPHCNGTHTESISHIVNELIPPHKAVSQPLMPAYLLSIEPQCYGDVDHDHDDYPVTAQDDDLMLCVKNLAVVSKSLHSGVKALIIRCLPNSGDKLTAAYGSQNMTPYFSQQAMKWLVEHTEIDHLLVDMPSIDRLHDEGMLSNHRLFWNIEPNNHQLQPHHHKHKTITEMVFVPDTTEDGLYLLNLQLPRLNLNAVPSNPVLYPLDIG